MKLTKYEQSGFVLETDTGFKLALDIGNKTPLEKLEDVSCDAVLVSHIHGDHFSIEQIKKLNPKKVYLNQECIELLGEESFSFEVIKIKAGETVSIEDIAVRIFNVDHGPNVSAPLAENFGFLLTVDNQTIYFAGDMFYPSGIDVSGLEVDYALIPVGGHYTFDPNEAFDFVKKFKKIGKVIAMHFERNNFIDPARHDEFVQLAGNVFLCE